jgi:hypothetical protein
MGNTHRRSVGYAFFMGFHMKNIGSIQQVPFVFQTQKPFPNKKIHTELHFSQVNRNGLQQDCFVSQKDGKIKTVQHLKKKLDR